jgi:hypothetical protein
VFTLVQLPNGTFACIQTGTQAVNPTQTIIVNPYVYDYAFSFAAK